MRTIRIAVGDELFGKVDEVVKKLKTTRSVFVCKALEYAISQANSRLLEQNHKKGYRKMPLADREFSIWESERESERAWGDSFKSVRPRSHR